MTDTGQGKFSTPLRMPADSLPRFETPLVPRNSISGRALVAVVAIMTFLASLTTGATVLVTRAAGEWQSEISREVTLQVSPVSGRDVDATVDKAVSAARAFPELPRSRRSRRRNPSNCSSLGSAAGFLSTNSPYRV